VNTRAREAVLRFMSGGSLIVGTKVELDQRHRK
jgi:hypothetical protein